MSVFLSWSGNDRAVKDVIAERLKQENIPFWESDENCDSDFSEECIANIRRSRVFIVIISEASMSRKSYVFNEVIEARQMENEGRLNILVYRITDQPFNERFSMQLNHVTDTNHVARKRNLGAMGSIDLLVRRVKHLLKCREEGRPEKPFDVYHPSIAGTKPLLGSYFVKGSRDGIMDEIDEGFRRSNVIILTELFGFGKKSVIRNHIANHEYDSAVEVQGAHDSLYDFFLNDLQFTNVNEGAFEQKDDATALKKKFEFLNKLNERQIVVISDVDIEDDPDELLLGLLTSVSCRIVIITQKTSDAYRDLFPVIEIGRMEAEYLTDLFFHYYDRTSLISREPLLPALNSFFDDIGGHTKTVEVAASVLAREMKSNPDEVIQYLTRGSGDGRELNDKIIDKLSGLIEMESFGENEQKILLVISLLANPTVEVKELREVLNSLNIEVGLSLFNLNSNRWIVYDIPSGTVYIEPIIARICVSRFADYSIISGCFTYMCDDFAGSMHKDMISILQVYSRMESMLRLLDMDKAAEIIKTLRTVSISTQKDEDRINAVVDGYTEWYKGLIAEVGEESESKALAASVIAWINTSILPVFKVSLLLPVLMDLGGSSAISSDAVDEIMSEMYDDVIGIQDNPIFAEAMESISVSAAGNTPDVLSLICQQIQLCFMNKDTNGLIKSVNYLIEELENHPESLQNTTTADTTLAVIRLISNVFINMGSYRTGTAIFERLIPLGWPGYHLHQLLLAYTNMLLIIGEDGETALSVMESADDLLEEISLSDGVDRHELKNIRREHNSIYAYALAINGNTDEAIAKADEFVSLGLSDLVNNAVDLFEKITDILFLQGRSAQAIEFINKYRRVIFECIGSTAILEGQKKTAESLLTLLEYNADGGQNAFTKGGEKTSQSYYERYGTKRGNNIILMMPYNRIADGVRRFDFSKYTNDELRAHTEKLRARAKSGEDRMKLASEAFALVSEAGLRVLGYRHHKVQYVGAAVMLDGRIAEILNGEGKTYTIPLVAYVNSLYEDTVFVLDNSKYLTDRNYRWMRGVYSLLGLKVDLLPRYNNIHEAGEMIESSNVVYAEFNNLGFYLAYREINGKGAEDRRMLAGCSAIIDEADSILVESARTPMIINGGRQKNEKRGERCRLAYKIAKEVYGKEEYYSLSTYGSINLKSPIYPLIEDSFRISVEAVEDTQELLGIERVVKGAIKSFGMVKGRDYFIKDNLICYENEENGTLTSIDAERGYFISMAHAMPSEMIGYYNTEIDHENIIINLIHTYEVLNRFSRLCGTSATASSFKKAFSDIYGLDVLAIPTVLPVRRVDKSIALYSRPEFKERDILDLIERKHAMNQPILLITKSIYDSTHYSALLSERGIEHRVLNATNSESSPEMLASAGVLGSILITTQMANRGVDIKLGGDAERMTLFDLVNAGVDVSHLDDILYTLPSEEIRSSELYRIYTATLEKNRMLVAANRQKVIEAGGLCVIGTEPYLDMRIEQQMRGRAGRQGDVGESHIFEGLDDRAIKMLLGNQVEFQRRMADSSGLDIVENRIITGSIERAKENVHKNRFKNMNIALEESRRTDSSKLELLSLIGGIGEEDKDRAIERLLDIWSENDGNINLVYDAIRDEISEHGHIVTVMYKKYSDILDPKTFNYNYSLYLTELANKTVKNTKLDDEVVEKLLVKYLYDGFYQHVTQMRELEVDYNSVDKKVNKMLEKVYAVNRCAMISDAVNKWLHALTFAKMKTPAAEVPKPKKDTQQYIVQRITSRNDPCPCGSGKKYKNCCANNSDNK